MPKIESLLARAGHEARKLAYRQQIRTAMIAAKGDKQQAADTLGIDRRDLAGTARDNGLDWDALVEECKQLREDGEKSTPDNENAA